MANEKANTQNLNTLQQNQTMNIGGKEYDIRTMQGDMQNPSAQRSPLAPPAPEKIPSAPGINAVQPPAGIFAKPTEPVKPLSTSAPIPATIAPEPLNKPTSDMGQPPFPAAPKMPPLSPFPNQVPPAPIKPPIMREEAAKPKLSAAAPVPHFIAQESHPSNGEPSLTPPAALFGKGPIGANVPPIPNTTKPPIPHASRAEQPPILSKPPIPPIPGAKKPPIPTPRTPLPPRTPQPHKTFPLAAVIILLLVIILGGGGLYYYDFIYLPHHQTGKQLTVTQPSTAPVTIPSTSATNPATTPSTASVTTPATSPSTAPATAAQTLPIPQTLFSVDATKTITADPNNLSLLAINLLGLLKEQYTPNTFTRVVIVTQNQNATSYMPLSDLFSALDVSVPANICSQPQNSSCLSTLMGMVNPNTYTLFIYADGTNNRLGLAAQYSNLTTLQNFMLAWEPSIPTSLAPILQTQNVSPATTTFQVNAYNGVDIRFMNFPTPQLSIDYGFATAKNLFLLATSKNSMFNLIGRTH